MRLCRFPVCGVGVAVGVGVRLQSVAFWQSVGALSALCRAAFWRLAVRLGRWAHVRCMWPVRAPVGRVGRLLAGIVAGWVGEFARVERLSLASALCPRVAVWLSGFRLAPRGLMV